MHYLQDEEKDVIFDALAYYSTHAIRNTPPKERTRLYTMIKIILHKINDFNEIISFDANSQEPAIEGAPPKKIEKVVPKRIPVEDHPHAAKPLPEKPPGVDSEHWEKMVNMGLKDLTEWPFTD